MKKREIRRRYGPKTSKLIVTKICAGDYVETSVPVQNFIAIRSRVFAPRQACDSAYKVIRLFLAGGGDSSVAQQPSPVRVLRSTRHAFVSCKYMPFGGREFQNLHFVRIILKENGNLGAIFDGTWKISAQKASTWTTS